MQLLILVCAHPSSSLLAVSQDTFLVRTFPSLVFVSSFLHLPSAPSHALCHSGHSSIGRPRWKAGPSKGGDNHHIPVVAHTDWWRCVSMDCMWINMYTFSMYIYVCMYVYVHMHMQHKYAHPICNSYYTLSIALCSKVSNILLGTCT